MPPQAARQSESAGASIFPPDSAIWRIARERACLLGGPAAAILQIAHPEVALGVANHSNFKQDSLGRLHRTMEAVHTIVFSPRREADAMAARVQAAHARVTGEKPLPYSAFSPDAQMWVLATLVQVSVETFGRFVAPLSGEDCARFYRDMRIFGRYFGLAENHGPQKWEDFRSYYEAVLGGGQLAGLPVSRELADHIARPRRPRALRVLWPFSRSLAAEFLPSPVREKLGFSRTPGVRLLAATLDWALPALLPGLPPLVRFVPQYLRAREGREIRLAFAEDSA